MTGSQAISILGNKLVKGFEINSDPAKSVYKQVYENFSEGLDETVNNKGIMLIGNIGVGKSMLMRIMQKLFKDSRRAFKWLSCAEVSDLMEYYPLAEIKTMYGRDLKIDLYLDDIGVGNAVYNKFGNTTNVISEILIERYELFVREGIKTHVSSNRPTSLDKEKFPNVITIETMYGDRIVDRLREMCETIVWKGESLRK